MVLSLTNHVLYKVYNYSLSHFSFVNEFNLLPQFFFRFLLFCFYFWCMQLLLRYIVRTEDYSLTLGVGIKLQRPGFIEIQQKSSIKRDAIPFRRVLLHPELRRTLMKKNTASLACISMIKLMNN